MNAEEFFNIGFGADIEKVGRKHVIELMRSFAKHYHEEQERSVDQPTEISQQRDQLLSALCDISRALQCDLLGEVNILEVAENAIKDVNRCGVKDVEGRVWYKIPPRYS